MLIDDNMMTPSKRDTGLVHRLERLTRSDGDSCLSRYQELGRQVEKRRGFAKTLARVRALSDKQRLKAVAVLRQTGELCACEVQAALGLDHATVSHHMSVLTSAGIVTSQRRGKWVYYRLEPGAFAEMRWS